jgi:hypothetical protein
MMVMMWIAVMIMWMMRRIVVEFIHIHIVAIVAI